MNEHATCDGAADVAGMLHFQKLDVYQPAIEFELIENELYERGADLLERVVAMLTKLIEP